jgi:hypothetical protein
MSTNFAHGSGGLSDMPAVLVAAQLALPATRGSPAGCYRDAPDKHRLAQVMRLQGSGTAAARRGRMT